MIIYIILSPIKKKNKKKLLKDNSTSEYVIKKIHLLSKDRNRHSNDEENINQR